VTQILESGNEQIIDYLYSSAADCNIKSLLISNKNDEGGKDIPEFRFEVAELTASVANLPISVSHFGALLQHISYLEKFRFSLLYLID